MDDTEKMPESFIMPQTDGKVLSLNINFYINDMYFIESNQVITDSVKCFYSFFTRDKTRQQVY